MIALTKRARPGPSDLESEPQVDLRVWRELRRVAPRAFGRLRVTKPLSHASKIRNLMSLSDSTCQRIASLVALDRVVLFMKGTPAQISGS